MWFQVSNKSCAEIKELNNPCHTGFYSIILSQQMQSLVNDGDSANLPGLVFLQCSLGGTWASHTNYTEVMTPKFWKLKSQRILILGRCSRFLSIIFLSNFLGWPNYSHNVPRQILGFRTRNHVIISIIDFPYAPRALLFLTEFYFTFLS